MKRRSLATHVAFVVAVTSIGVIGLGASAGAETTVVAIEAAEHQIAAEQETASTFPLLTQQMVTLNTQLLHSGDSSGVATSTNCKRRKSWHRANFNPILGEGGKAYEIVLVGNWCWRRGVVTSFSFTKDFSVGGQWYNFWRWVGWENTTTGGCVGCSHVYRRIKGHLELCYTLLSLGPLCNDDFPYASLTLRGDGTAAADDGVG